MADKKGRFVLKNISGGRNGYSPPWNIAADECADAVNVDFYGTPFARKVGGAANQSALSGATTVGVYSSFGRHVPGTNPALAELWATDDSATPIVNRLAGGTAWSAPTLKDAPTGNGWDFSSASINGKFFLGYQSAQARMHVWDAATVRRAGLIAPVAPTAAETGSGAGSGLIAFDATSASGVVPTTTSVTFAHTCAGSNRILFVLAGNSGFSTTITGVTYNGVALTQIGTAVQNASGSTWVGLWYLLAPTTGAHNIIVSANSSVTLDCAGASYTNVRQSTIPDVSVAAATQTVTLTTITNQSWTLIASATDVASPTTGAGTTLRQSTLNGRFLGDSNGPISPVGATSLAIGNGAVWNSIMVAFAPASSTYQATGRRYFRVRWTRQSAGITLGRSEPGASITFDPSGTGTATTVTQPAVANEGETHWELEASADNVTFYRIATVAIATTTYDDSVGPSAYSNSPLSALTGVYTLLPSAKFVKADQGRLLTFGSYTPADKQNDIIVSAVIGSLDVSDEERVDTTTNYRIGLDENDSGIPTGLLGPVNNSYLAFKDRQSWLLTATGTSAQPYRQDVLSKTVGAVGPTAMDTGEDESGNACAYWMSHRGPFRWGLKGIEYIGQNVEDYVLPSGNSQAVINLAATKVVSVVRYYPDLRQVWFWWATGSSNDPNQLFKFHIVTGGWTRVPSTDGPANVRCAVVFSDTIGASMSRNNKLYVGQAAGNNRLWKMETGTDYAGTTFKGYVITADIEPGGEGYVGEVGDAVILAKAASGVTITDVVTADFGVASKTGTALLTAVGSETRVRPAILETGLNDVGFVNHQIGDAAATANTWTLERLIIPVEKHRAASA